MSERVVLAVDGGIASAAALSWVGDRASSVDLSVEITAVVGLDTELPLGSESEYRDRYEEVLLRASEKLRARAPRAEITTRIHRGLPYDALVDASRASDLLVVGSNKTSPIVGVLHGTLPLKIAGRSLCPTVIVPAAWRPSRGNVIAGWADDETSDAALAFAAREAVSRYASLTVVHSWSTPPDTALDLPASALVVDELIAAHQGLLSQASDRIRARNPGLVVTEELVSGSAAVAIVRAASDAALVVVGSRGRGVAADFFLGSTSHDVLLNLPSPVAVLPSRARVAEAIAAASSADTESTL